jgi:ubiquinone/menaquinone biosynthesis C-methylase UbiE
LFLDGSELIPDLPDSLRESGAIEVRKRLGTISGGDVLDVGTDNGDFIGVLMKTLKDYTSFTGVDISDKGLEKARKRFKDDQAKFMVMNAESLTFKSNGFDTVCISYSVHHLENIDTVLSEMYRVLKPGGNFIIQEMYSDGEQTAAQIADRDIHHFEAKVDTLLGIPHFETLSRDRLRNLIDKIRLSEVEALESSWSVKCLFCDNAQQCANPMNNEIISSRITNLDKLLSKVKEHPSFDELREEAELLKDRLKANGSSEPSLVYFFGKK